MLEMYADPSCPGHSYVLQGNYEIEDIKVQQSLSPSQWNVRPGMHIGMGVISRVPVWADAFVTLLTHNHSWLCLLHNLVSKREVTFCCSWYVLKRTMTLILLLTVSFIANFAIPTMALCYFGIKLRIF